jgi:hypothetical protein
VDPPDKTSLHLRGAAGNAESPMAAVDLGDRLTDPDPGERPAAARPAWSPAALGPTPRAPSTEEEHSYV